MIRIGSEIPPIKYFLLEYAHKFSRDFSKKFLEKSPLKILSKFLRELPQKFFLGFLQNST